MQSEFVYLREIAETVGCHPRTVIRRFVKTGKLRFKKYGKKNVISRSDFNEFIAKLLEEKPRGE